MGIREQDAGLEEFKRAEAEIRLVFQRDLDELLRDRPDAGLQPGDGRAIFAFADRAVSTYHRATLDSSSLPPLSRAQYHEIRQKLYFSRIGLGPLPRLLEEPGVEDIHIDGTREVTLNYGDRLQRIPNPFTTEEELITLIRFYAEEAGKHFDTGSPIVTVVLRDGSPMNAILPPVAKPMAITIRRHQLGRFKVLEELARSGVIPGAAMRLLRAAVLARLNLVISGQTGCGKTTVARVLALLIPDDERTFVLETETELWLHDLRDHFISLEEREANVENAGRITLRDLVTRAALRQRPRRIIVGEVRGPEALDMLRALVSGHDGSLSTLHASSPREAVSTLQMLAMSAEPQPPRDVVDQLVGRAVDLVVHLGQYKRGDVEVRRLSSICFVDHNLENPSLPIVQEACRYVPADDDWEWDTNSIRFMPRKVAVKFETEGDSAFQLAQSVEKRPWTPA